VSLVAQTGLQFDLRSAQGKLIASLVAALAEFERDLRASGSVPVLRPHANVASCSAGGRNSGSRRTVSRRKCSSSSAKDSLTAKSATGLG
jgi:hypothetical protein